MPTLLSGLDVKDPALTATIERIVTLVTGESKVRTATVSPFDDLNSSTSLKTCRLFLEAATECLSRCRSKISLTSDSCLKLRLLTTIGMSGGGRR